MSQIKYHHSAAMTKLCSRASLRDLKEKIRQTTIPFVSSAILGTNLRSLSHVAMSMNDTRARYISVITFSLFFFFSGILYDYCGYSFPEKIQKIFQMISFRTSFPIFSILFSAFISISQGWAIINCVSLLISGSFPLPYFFGLLAYIIASYFAQRSNFDPFGSIMRDSMLSKTQASTDRIEPSLRTAPPTSVFLCVLMQLLAVTAYLFCHNIYLPPR
ncbi:hypothetical protein [Candidatus Similichlamydia laticola]|uniref:Uncharacterized protein n=1 Tax=Candidatus Similichlamydia laticola TaxID=2170265 RepID=A0A369KDJ7_9BACT|nr:hypothetical protein [Candidatus Similichlamydia laticola]RDB31682.1 hypothetical protein HAT2_00190 [Candidatus Similichlamydia laticola]